MPQSNDILKNYSEEVGEILTKTPSWFTRYGTSVFFATIAIILLASFFIQYPDVVNANATITSQQPPVSLIAQVTGKIKALLVKDNQSVSNGELLAVIENPAEYLHVLEIEQKLSPFHNSIEKDFFPTDFVFYNYNLGEIQTAYSAFNKALIEYNTYLELNYFERKIAAQENQIIKYKALFEKNVLQEKAIKEEFDLAAKKYQIDSTLKSGGALAETQFDETKSLLLQKKSAFHGASSNIVQTQIQISDLEKSITELKIQNIQEKSKLQTELKKSIEYLQSQIVFWKQKYLLVSPIDGKVSFFNFWSENQTVTAGEEVMNIAPENAGEVIGKLIFEIRGSAKVLEGQTVNIKLANYPAEEYGMIVGKLRPVSLIPKNQSYTAEVELVNGLMTTYNKELEFKQQMQGTAEIITSDRSLMMRIFSRFKFLIEKHF